MGAEQYQAPDRRPVANFQSVADEDLVFATHDRAVAPVTETAADLLLPGFVPAAQPPAPPEPAAGLSFVDAAPATPDAPLPGISFAAPPAAGAPPAAPLPGVSFDAPMPPVGSLSAFHLSSAASATPATELPWITRDPVPVRPEAQREGWRRRWSDEVDRAATASMKSLRNEALHVTWRAALTAVATAGGAEGSNPG